MKTWQTTLSSITGNPYINEYFTPSSVFFDIETTGFSAACNQVYMIGYAVRTDSGIFITQLFAECPEQEREIISAFLELLSQYDTLISFNGTGFDVPFLKKRCAHHKMPEHLDSFRHLDIYKQLSRYKTILNLPNLKQKTLEKFLGIEREDLYSGGDLISIYLDYAALNYENAAISPDEACRLLRLHNYEDMKGMIRLLGLLSYPSFFEGQFQTASWKTNNWKTYEGTESWELILSLEPELPLPKPFSCTLGKLRISSSCNPTTNSQADSSCNPTTNSQADGSCNPTTNSQADGSCNPTTNSQADGSCNQVKLRMELFTGELKYFYPNYKDYYYLPMEDRALHKSVASYVDKDYRIQATAATCYCKKSGRFLPQCQELFSPAFKQEYQDKISWFELTETFASDKENLKKYAAELLKYIVSNF